MSKRERSLAQPQGRQRKKPGSTGKGKYYHIAVRPKTEFTTFRTQDVGQPGGLQRVAGKRPSGSWDTVKWILSKEDAHVENGRLVPDSQAAKDLLAELGAAPVHVRGDRFSARPRPNIAEKDKPTPAQKRAWRENIKKAQAARRS